MRAAAVSWSASRRGDDGQSRCCPLLASPAIDSVPFHLCELSEEVAMQRLGVVGAGTMGIGIVQVAAQQGLDVVGCEVDQSRVRTAMDGLRSILDRLVTRGRLAQSDVDAALGRIQPTTQFADLAEVDCVIEVVPEILDL